MAGRDSIGGGGRGSLVGISSCSSCGGGGGDGVVLLVLVFGPVCGGPNFGEHGGVGSFGFLFLVVLRGKVFFSFKLSWMS